MNQSSSNKDKISREDFKAKYKIIPPTSIEYEKGDGSVIGDGGFGVVRKAVFNGKIVVAVKTLEIKGLENSNQNQKESIQNMALKLFLEEAKTMRQVDDHPRIVKFIGYVYETTSIVMEYVSGGSLFDYIRDNPETMTCKEWPYSSQLYYLFNLLSL